ncbi:MAG TPA: hypothetical protein DEP51_04855 [Clostridiales bacterium]|nr:hypothetical protein [Clostridiales bacterium]
MINSKNSLINRKDFNKNCSNNDKIVLIDHNNGKEIIKDNNKEKFRKLVEIPHEEIEIFNLQKAYKEGKIKEIDITKEEYDKLIKLYETQNQRLKEKISFKKSKIRKRLNDLNSNKNS